jgi:thiamine biosynthesis lipoprotein
MPFSSRPKRQINRAQPLLGTLVSIRASGLAEDMDRIVTCGFSEIADIHRLMSFHEPDSDLSRLNRHALETAVTVDGRTFEVLCAAQEMAACSSGLFDITIAGQLVSWGLLPRPVSPYEPDPEASWRDVELFGGNQVKFHKPLWVDLGGIAKGYAVDRAIDRMQAESPGQYLVNAGGDLRVSGPAGERIQFRIPGLKLDRIPALDIENGSVASSGGLERGSGYGRRVIGPHIHGLRRRAAGTRSFVSVVAEKCIVADALTKIVLARGLRSASLLEKFGATAYLYNRRDGGRILGAGAARKDI